MRKLQITGVLNSTKQKSLRGYYNNLEQMRKERRTVKEALLENTQIQANTLKLLYNIEHSPFSNVKDDTGYGGI